MRSARTHARTRTYPRARAHRRTDKYVITYCLSSATMVSWTHLSVMSYVHFSLVQVSVEWFLLLLLLISLWLYISHALCFYYKASHFKILSAACLKQFRVLKLQCLLTDLCFSSSRVMMSGLLWGMILSVCTCWFLGYFTLLTYATVPVSDGDLRFPCLIGKGRKFPLYNYEGIIINNACQFTFLCAGKQIFRLPGGDKRRNVV